MKLIILCIVLFCCFRKINCLSKSMESKAAEKVENAPRNRPCPDANAIFPCNCSFDLDYKMTMDCSNVTSDEKLRSVFNQTFPFYYFYKLYVYNNHYLTSLLSDVFGNSTFEFIEFYFVTFLDIIDYDIFAKMENTLNKIHFRQCSLNEFIFDFSSFSILDSFYLELHYLSSFNVTAPTVTSLTLESSNFSQNHFNADLPNLKQLYLKRNYLEQIPNLNQYTKLLELDLSSNALTDVPLGAICHSDSLEEVYLLGNDIKNVEVDSICVTDGGWVNIDYNELTTLLEEVYKPIVESVRGDGLEIYPNLFECGCDIAWLITNDSYMEKITLDTSCSDGERFTDLDPAMYETLC